MSNFRQVDRATGFLLPPSVDDWLPERHLARFVVEVIERLDLSWMVKAYRGSGSASYHPSILLGLLVYGYATGVFSSRKLERATYDSVAFRDHGPAWREANRGHVSLGQLKVMSAIEDCRTAALGGHVMRCENDACGYTSIAYNSCRNRHCPKCQGGQAREWMAAREAEPHTPNCPCCGSKMRIIEVFQRGQTPHHKASPCPPSIRIDTS
jgi:hypothetical protein